MSGERADRTAQLYHLRGDKALQLEAVVAAKKAAVGMPLWDAAREDKGEMNGHVYSGIITKGHLWGREDDIYLSKHLYLSARERGRQPWTSKPVADRPFLELMRRARPELLRHSLAAARLAAAEGSFRAFRGASSQLNHRVPVAQPPVVNRAEAPVPV